MNLIRVQVLLEPRQLKSLKKAAMRSNKSVSQLLRDIINIYLAEMFPEEDEVLQTLHSIKSIRERQTSETDLIIPDTFQAEVDDSGEVNL